MAVEASETIIAGGAAGDYTTVRHLVLRGSHMDMGRHLAELTKERHHGFLLPAVDPLLTRLNREYIQEKWPSHHQRMQGAAGSWDADLTADEYVFASLYGLPACSVVYYPGNTTANGHATMSRNYDFPIFPEGHPGSCRSPYLIETHPEEGYPCLYMSSMDLLGTCLDGVNSEGLAMSMLMDVETGISVLDPEFPTNACYGFSDLMDIYPSVGVMSTQLTLYILETCRDADEAREALLTTLHYGLGGPAHYIIGDRNGNGFVFEGLMQGNKPVIHDCGGAPLPVTNHPLREHTPLDHYEVRDSLERLNTFRKRIADQSTPFDMSAIRATAESVTCEKPGGVELVGGMTADTPVRTIWHGYYDLEERSLTVNYYLRESGDHTAPAIHRSDDLHFRLEA